MEDRNATLSRSQGPLTDATVRPATIRALSCWVRDLRCGATSAGGLKRFARSCFFNSTLTIDSTVRMVWFMSVDTF